MTCSHRYLNRRSQASESWVCDNAPLCHFEVNLADFERGTLIALSSALQSRSELNLTKIKDRVLYRTLAKVLTTEMIERWLQVRSERRRWGTSTHINNTKRREPS